MQSSDRKKTKSAPKNAAIVMIAGALVVLFAVVFTREQESRHTTVRLASGQEFRLEKADTPTRRIKGLSGRKMLHPQEGMVFIYDTSATRCIWMKDMYFPIDIVWLDAGRRVIATETRVFPSTYPRKFCHQGHYVIELPIGAAQGVGPGQKLSF